jgi:chemotaxis protein MotA
VDLGSVVGIVLAFGALIGSVLMEGGALRALINVPATVIVFGGTMGAALLSMPLPVCLRGIPLVLMCFKNKHHARGEIIQLIVRFATTARKEGLLSLENEVATLEDPFMRKGVELVVDGTDSDMIREIMEAEIACQAERHKEGQKLFTTLGGLAPTLGVIGTVMGLVHMMAKLDDPSKMGPAIAGAFLATLYGVSSANLIFLPVGSKLTILSHEEKASREMMLEGLLALQTGETPIAIEQRLQSYLTPKERGAVNSTGSDDAAAMARAA